MITIETLDDKLFSFNGVSIPKNYEAQATGVDNSLEIISTGRDRDVLQNSKKYDEFEINGIVPSSLNEAITLINEIVFSNGGGANSTFSIVEKIDELISVTQDENNETQELLKEIQLIPVDFELGEGTYDKSNILTGHYSGSETKIHSIQVLSQDAGAFSLRFVGDVNHNFNENMQQVKAVKNQELADFELVVNPEHNITINLELLTI